MLKWSSEDGERAAAGVLAERVPGRVGAREVGGAQDHAPAHQEGEETDQATAAVVGSLKRIQDPVQNFFS